MGILSIAETKTESVLPEVYITDAPPSKSVFENRLRLLTLSNTAWLTEPILPTLPNRNPALFSIDLKFFTIRTEHFIGITAFNESVRASDFRFPLELTLENTTLNPNLV